MDMKAIEQTLRRTLDDARVSRGEARVLKELLEAEAPSRSEQASLRALIFRLASEAMLRHEDRALLQWAEDALRALRGATTAPERRTVSEAHFFPDPRSLRRVVALIDACQRTLDVCVFTITHDDLAEALLQAHRRGVAVRIISDDEKAGDTGSDVLALGRAGVPVRVDATPDHMHNKFAIFDGRALLTGSFNWTRSAVRANRENVIVTDDPTLLRRFVEEFDALWEAFDG